MSVLTVEKVSHGFGGRQILEDASFRLNKGEHVGLVGANGEGKTTFLNIITGNLMPDAGTVSWCNHITTGYLDQRTTLSQGPSERCCERLLATTLTSKKKCWKPMTKWLQHRMMR